MNISKGIKFAHSRFSIFINPWYIYRRELFIQIEHLTTYWTDKKVLDVGCGSKPYDLLFREAVCYVGVDVEVSGHDHRSSEIDHFYDGEHLPFEDATFDVIVLFEVIEHVKDIDLLLQEIYRVLSPGGMLICSSPFLWELHEKPFDFRRLTVFGLRELMVRHKFTPRIETRHVSFFPSIFQMLNNRLVLLIGSSILLKLFFLPLIIITNLLGIFCSILFPIAKDFYLFNITVCSKNKD